MNMENNKEVKNIADHQEQQHPIEAPPPQGYPLADNPLQLPELQRLPANSEMDIARDENEQGCCCPHGCLRGLGIEPCGVWSWYFAICCIALFELMTCCCCCMHCCR